MRQSVTRLIDFVPGQIYRRRDLHSHLGGQRQGGISTPKQAPIIILVTGDAGKQHGYEDKWTEDGVFLYTGEGQHGDMKFVAGNKAIRDHAQNGKDLHLFEQVKQSSKKGFLRYKGQLIYTGHSFQQRPDTKGHTRQAIIFELAPLEAFTHSQTEQEPSDDDALRGATLDELRSRALADSATARTPSERKASWRRRSRAIRLYVLRRSCGKCEACGQTAPFVTAQDEPYLEPHHIRRLSDGGPDHPRWVIAVCPNCHRRAHYAKECAAFNESLADIVRRLEASSNGRAATV